MTIELAQPATLPILSHWIAGRPVEVLPEVTERWREPGRRAALSLVFPGNS